MGERKIADAAEAEQLLEAWEASGLRMGAFCEARGLNYRSLNLWRTNLARWRRQAQRDPTPALNLVELVATQAPQEQVRYRLHVGGVILEVEDDFDENTVLRLLRVARQC